MATADVLAIIAAVTVAVLVGALITTLFLLSRTLRDLRDAADRLRADALPLVQELRATVRDAGREVDRVDRLVSSAEQLGDTVDSASRLAYRTLASPVVKAMAIGTGVARARDRLRGEPSDGAPVANPKPERRRRRGA